MSTARVLVVEDEAIIGMELEDELVSLGFEVVAVVRQGEEAVRRALAARPDLVLMDIHLRGPLDGVAAALAIVAASTVPVVFVTAHVDARTRERAAAVGAVGYLTKPFADGDLRAVVDRALRRT